MVPTTSKTDPVFPPAGFTAVLVFDDPTPDAYINARICQASMEFASRYSDLRDREMADFFDLVILIGRKMVSVWKHLQAYHAEEQRLIAKFKDSTDGHTEFSQNLFEDFDIFAVQIKSTLDHVAKIMRPMLGSKWVMYTFGDKGDKVLNALKNLGKGYKGYVRTMEHLLFTDQNKEWLTAIIDSRDRTNHCQAGGMKIEKFGVSKQEDGTVRVPTWSDQQLLADAMDAIWVLFFHFVEDFIMCALHFRIPSDKYGVFRSMVVLPSRSSSWKVLPKADADALIARLGMTPVYNE